MYKRQPQLILTYLETNLLPSYYQTIYDYHTYPYQKTLQSIEQLKWYLSSNELNKIYKHLQFILNNPYFFSNFLIKNGSIFYAINLGNISISKCLYYIQHIYETKQINPTFLQSFSSIEEFSTSFYFHSYENEYSIQTYIINKDLPSSKDLHIVGTIYENEPNYTILLDTSLFSRY